MEHKYWEERLHGYLDNELAPADHTAVENHINGCEKCAANLSYFKGLKKRVNSYKDSVEIPEAVQERISKLFLRKKNPIRRFLVPAAGLALAAALVLALILPQTLNQTYLFIEDVVKGHLVCHDCSIADKAGLAKFALCQDGHRLGLATADGALWRIACDSVGKDVVSDLKLIGKQVEIRGKILQTERLIRIEEMHEVVQKRASLAH